MIVMNVIQEFYDSGFQVLAYQELNEFTGQYLLRFEGFQYPHDAGNYEAWCLLVGDKNRHRGARLLAKSLGVMNTWAEARALEPTDDTPPKETPE